MTAAIAPAADRPRGTGGPRPLPCVRPIWSQHYWLRWPASRPSRPGRLGERRGNDVRPADRGEANEADAAGAVARRPHGGPQAEAGLADADGDRSG